MIENHRFVGRVMGTLLPILAFLMAFSIRAQEGDPTLAGWEHLRDPEVEEQAVSKVNKSVTNSNF